MVELRQVSKRFGEFVAVDGVDLRVEGGEFLTLLGPSGCGKTTLLRMIGGFETPSQGTVWVDGQDVTGLPPYRRDVNQVFQSYALFPHLSVWGNIEFGLKMKRLPRGQRHQRVREAIELVCLGGMETRRPAQLSGGQKQRVALARALVCRPRVLLLDEPLAALDAKLRRAMQIELKRLQARVGITFVFVTHDQDEALVVSDRVAVMNQGRIEQLATAAEIYHKPATAFVADFLGQANVMEAALLTRDADQAELLVAGKLHLRVPCSALPDGTAPAFVSVRPERVRVASGPVASENVFGGCVRELIFRGASHQLLIETEMGRTVSALVSDDGTITRRGDRVVCQIAPEDIVVLPRG